MSAKIILFCFLLAVVALEIQSQLVYTSPYVYPAYTYPYYGWVWGSNKNGSPGAGSAPSGPIGGAPSFTNNAPKF